MYKPKNSIRSLLYVILFITCCSGQSKGNQSGKSILEQQSYTSKNSKLVKTQGTTVHQNVHCSLQDKNGNLWFGTTGEGVYRYDGKEFLQFTEKDGLSNNSIWSILEDKSGNIWFGTDNGVSRYDGKSISIIPLIINNSGGYGLSVIRPGKNAVWSILQDKTGIIWFGTSEGLYWYDGNLFYRFLDKAGISNNQHLTLKGIQCLLEDRNGSIWMGSGPFAEEGVIHFDGKSVINSKPNGDGWIRYMVSDKMGDIWFSGRLNGVFRYDGKNFRSFTEKINIGSAIFVDKTGNIWFDGGEKNGSIESINGICRFDGKTFENFTTKDGIGKKSVWNIFEDRKGNIWFGTRNCELYRYDGKSFVKLSK